MNARKWVAASVVVGVMAIAAVIVYALPPSARVFRTVVSMLTVQQGTDPLQFTYHLQDGSNLVALALGTAPTSNQVFAMLINCESSGADLVMYDESNSNILVIATSDNITTVKQQAIHKLTAGHTNDERFVALFNVVSTNDLAGGYLTVAGRLHLDTSGCPAAVLIAINRDAEDASFDDKDVTDMEQDAKFKDMYRAGEGHFMGVLDVISGGSTNAWLVPLGHMTFRRQLEQLTLD
ncbi:MAG: hypothetical protein ACLPT4_10550 [Verrucomicrobiia bacterium]